MYIVIFLLNQLIRQMELNPSSLIIKGLSSDYRTVIYFYELRVEVFKLRDRRFSYIYYKGNCIPYEDSKTQQLIERICQLL